MSRLVKVGLGIVGVCLLAAAFVVQDWYRFATSGQIDPKRGIYGNSHLEVWIDVNLMMPSAMRKWGCKTLLDREAAIIGGIGRAPHGCQPDYDPNAAPLSVAEALSSSFTTHAGLAADSKGATTAQKEQVIACMKSAMPSAITPEQTSALNANPSAEVLMKVNKVGTEVMKDCLSKAGL